MSRAARVIPLDLLDLAGPADVAPLAGELRGREHGDDLGRQRRADDAPAEAEHVAVVVLDGLVGRVGVVRDDRADAGDLRGRDRDTRARAADDDRPLGVAAPDRLARLARLVGVVHGLRGVRPEVDRLVAELLERLQDERLQREARMVKGAGDLHGRFSLWSSSHSWAAFSAAPSTPARGAGRNGVRGAGWSRTSRALATRPPITTSGGS